MVKSEYICFNCQDVLSVIFCKTDPKPTEMIILRKGVGERRIVTTPYHLLHIMPLSLKICNDNNTVIKISLVTYYPGYPSTVASFGKFREVIWNTVSCRKRHVVMILILSARVG